MKYILIAVLCFSAAHLMAQDGIEGTEAFVYLVDKDDTVIEYIKVGLDNTPKPTIVFLQGSLPVPLVIGFEDFNHINLPFDYRMVTDQYNLVVISMPGIPVFAKVDQLNKQYCYITDQENSQSFSEEFLKANDLQTFVKRTQRVIEDLCSKPWVEKGSTILIGYSQGAKIASVVACQNNQVASVALLGFNPYGRYEEKLRRNRQDFVSGKIKDEDYAYNLNELYDNWRDINDTPDDYLKGHNAASSFSISYMPYLMQIDVPVYITFGTHDFIAANSDLIPLAFIKAGKTNYAYTPYIGLDHNFFEIKDGKPDYEKGPFWDGVIEDILIWLRG